VTFGPSTSGLPGLGRETPPVNHFVSEARLPSPREGCPVNRELKFPDSDPATNQPGRAIATQAIPTRANASKASAAQANAAEHDGTPVGDPVIRVRGLRMSYGSGNGRADGARGVEALAGIDLELYRGEIFGFLGPNGAGKTTTVEILEGYRRPTAGEVSVLGVDPYQADRAWRSRIGVVLQESEPEAELTVEECVSLYAGYYPHARPVLETLELVGLADRPKMRCGRLSGGQRRRLDVALALIGDPEVLFLDEPTTGFDPAARRSAWEVIASLQKLGKTIFLTTHYMEEAEQLADRIQVIVAGRIVAEGTPATLGGRNVQQTIVSFTLPPGISTADLPPAAPWAVDGDKSGRIEAETTRPLPVLGALANWAQARQIDLPDLQVLRPTLEDIYLQLTQGTR